MEESTGDSQSLCYLCFIYNFTVREQQWRQAGTSSSARFTREHRVLLLLPQRLPPQSILTLERRRGLAPSSLALCLSLFQASCSCFHSSTSSPSPFSWGWAWKEVGLEVDLKSPKDGPKGTRFPPSLLPSCILVQKSCPLLTLYISQKSALIHTTSILLLEGTQDLALKTLSNTWCCRITLGTPAIQSISHFLVLQLSQLIIHHDDHLHPFQSTVNVCCWPSPCKPSLLARGRKIVWLRLMCRDCRPTLICTRHHQRLDSFYMQEIEEKSSL